MFGRGDKSDVRVSSHNAGWRDERHGPRRCLRQVETRGGLVHAGPGKLGVPDQALLHKEAYAGREGALGTRERSEKHSIQAFQERRGFNTMWWTHLWAPRGSEELQDNPGSQQSELPLMEFSCFSFSLSLDSAHLPRRHPWERPGNELQLHRIPASWNLSGLASQPVSELGAERGLRKRGHDYWGGFCSPWPTLLRQWLEQGPWNPRDAICRGGASGIGALCSLSLGPWY